MRYGTDWTTNLLYRRAENAQTQAEAVYPHRDESVRRRRKNDYPAFKAELNAPDEYRLYTTATANKNDKKSETGCSK